MANNIITIDIPRTTPAVILYRRGMDATNQAARWGGSVSTALIYRDTALSQASLLSSLTLI